MCMINTISKWSTDFFQLENYSSQSSNEAGLDNSGDDQESVSGHSAERSKTEQIYNNLKRGITRNLNVLKYRYI